MTRKYLLLACIIPVLGACASPINVKVYVAPVSEALDSGRGVLMQTLESSVLASGWKILKIDYETGVVEALSPTLRIQETMTRERWFFNIQGYQVSASMLFEVRWSDSHDWSSEDTVCSSYDYSREMAFLKQLEASLPKQGSSRLAGLTR